MIKAGPYRSRFFLALKIAPPAVVTIIAVGGTGFLTLLAHTEFQFFDHGHAPEDAARLIGMVVVLVSGLAVTAIAHHLMTHAESPARAKTGGWSLLDVLSLAALVTLAAAFAVLDMTFCIGESTDGVPMALVLGLAAIAPVFFDRGLRMRKLLVAIAVYSVFAGWIVVQRQIDWNMRRHFLRAFSQIHPGMTMEKVEDVMRRQFRGKRPVGESWKTVARYTLDPEDGRFNSEFILIETDEGKVVRAEYLRD
jgi:hypothetical protein